MFVNPFPDPRITKTADGVIAVGGDFIPELVIVAYENGIFPWPHDDVDELLWFCPEQRGVLLFEELHLSKSFQKWIRKNEIELEIKINSDFKSIITECQKQIRPGQQGTWITDEMIECYQQMFHLGKVNCVGVYKNDQLVGGIYGVRSKKYFSCESMFFKESNMSKWAFVKLVHELKTQGLNWMDIQMVTDISGSFGGKYISKKMFLDWIGK